MNSIWSLWTIALKLALGAFILSETVRKVPRRIKTGWRATNEAGIYGFPDFWDVTHVSSHRIESSSQDVTIDWCLDWCLILHLACHLVQEASGAPSQQNTRRNLETHRIFWDPSEPSNFGSEVPGSQRCAVSVFLMSDPLEDFESLPGSRMSCNQFRGKAW